MERVEDRLSICDPGDPVCAVESFDAQTQIEELATETGETQRTKMATDGHRLTLIRNKQIESVNIRVDLWLICLLSVSLCLCG